MKLATAYKVVNLVQAHREAEQLVVDIQRRYDKALKFQLQGFSINIPDEEDDLESLISLEDEGEVQMFFEFLLDVAQRRVKVYEADIDKVLPEPNVSTLSILRYRYEDIQNASNRYLPRAEELTLSDLPISATELANADEVWVVSGDNSYQLVPSKKQD
jgi:hypothetical protein